MTSENPGSAPASTTVGGVRPDPGSSVGALIESQLQDVERKVEKDGDRWAVTLAQTVPLSRTDLWTALTDPAVMRLWFSPVDGDPRTDDSFTVMAMGATVSKTECEPERRALLDWPMGPNPSTLELRLDDVDDSPSGKTATRLTATHTVPDDDHFAAFGPAAVGAGWDGALLGLALHALAPAADHADAMTGFEETAEGRRFTVETCRAWEDAHVSAGVEPDDAHARAVRTAAFYLGDE